ncbi:MAG TPA: DUF1501 domain-containing protein [Planctomycetota bacterium]|nr:DUF1501 domain-containing protein [Planctomycetota bacterium]
MLHFPRYFAPPPPSCCSRRDFLGRAGSGFGLLALAGLLGEQFPALADDAKDPMAPRPSHFPAKAKSVIWLFMNGGPSQVDTWDYKPELDKRDGKELEGFDKNTGFFPGQVGPLMKSPFAFKQYGQSGAWASELFPTLAQHSDEMAFIYSCFTNSNNHAPALFEMNTGMSRMGFPCMGAWVTYGLGSENRNLPGFVVMYDTMGRGIPKGHALNWGTGFLPSIYQGTALNAQGAPIDNLYRDKTMSDDEQRKQLDLMKRLNKHHAENQEQESELAARIESFELAYRMQMAAPEALDFAKESEATLKLYGIGDQKCEHFGKQCLMARRLVERGVRFVQIYSGGMDNQLSWDGHEDIKGNHGGFAREVDIPIAGLLSDMKSRGLLDSTLIICAGEFGRLPISQKAAKPGRDHNPHAFTTWLAGAGVKGGAQYGKTDELGFKAVENRVSINDLHATILHLIGLDHTKLTYRFNGRDYRLTDVAGEVVKAVLG